MPAKKLEFDFSELSGGKVPVPPSETTEKKSREAPKKVEPPKVKPTDILLAIPAEGGRWYSRDLAYCTAEEFAAWISVVFPDPSQVTDKESLKHYEHGAVRLEMFKKIVNFHKHVNFSNKPKPQPVC